jgi:hypothetical protein
VAAISISERWLRSNQGSSSRNVFHASNCLCVLNHFGASPNGPCDEWFFAIFESFWIPSCAPGDLRFDERDAGTSHEYPSKYKSLQFLGWGPQLQR